MYSTFVEIPFIEGTKLKQSAYSAEIIRSLVEIPFIEGTKLKLLLKYLVTRITKSRNPFY